MPCDGILMGFNPINMRRNLHNKGNFLLTSRTATGQFCVKNK